MIAVNEKYIETHRHQVGEYAAEERIQRARVELIEREGRLRAMQRFVGGKAAGTSPINANAGRDEE